MNEKQPVLWKKIDLIRARGDEEPGPLRFIVTMELASRRTFTDTMDLVTLL